MQENKINYETITMGDTWRCDRFRDDRNSRLYCCKNTFPEGIDGTCIRDPKSIILGSEEGDTNPGYIEFSSDLKMKCTRAAGDFGNKKSKTCYFPGDIHGSAIRNWASLKDVTP